MTPLPCPSCGRAMEARTFDRLYGRTLTLDLCAACQLLWFDDAELLQLSPAGTLQVLSAIDQAQTAARHPMAERLACPRCRTALRQAHDQQRNTRFTYWRCPAGHGRLLTHFQFLRAKNFVRSLDAGEVARLREHVRQVNCSNCGAPVDVERGAACAFCGSPIAILDPEQVRAAAEELARAAAERQAVDPALPLRLAAERLRAERAFAEALDGPGWQSLVREDGADLVGAGLRAIARFFRG